MSMEHGTPGNGHDDEIRRTMRDMYAPPRGELYWRGLESRIMARIAKAADVEWWSFFGGWVRVGLAAAAVAVIVAGTMLARSRDVQARLAYEEAIESASGIPVAGPASSRAAERDAARDATLRYVMSY
ncbi:MAG TPA: hypothetical protein VFG84_07630 [Gemmatimonadaceae bacterium]|nr:hypothetical protein [Gemmatimonadaceae bacterium]